MDKELLEAIGKMLEPLMKEQREIRDDLQSIKADVVQIPEIRRDVNVILECHQGISEKLAKLDKVADDVDEIKIKVSAIEHVTQDNTSQIKQLRKVD